LVPHKREQGGYGGGRTWVFAPVRDRHERR